MATTTMTHNVPTEIMTLPMAMAMDTEETDLLLITEFNFFFV